MTLLVILLPPRDRLGSRSLAPAAEPALRAASGVSAEWSFVFSTDGRNAQQVGQAVLSSLPKADQTVLVLPEADVSWHRIDIPRAPAARMRAALAGVLEERLLDEDEALHFALGEDAAPGRAGWVAVTDGRRLAAALTALEANGRSVDRAVPSLWPGRGRGHFHTGGDVEGATIAEDDFPWLSLALPSGVCNIRMAGGLARTVLPHGALDEVRWTANPGAAQAAERLLGQPVPLMREPQRALEAAAEGVNLRQFDLVSRNRGTRALFDAARRIFTAEWRPVRYGLAALVALQLVGLNAYAWQQRQALQDKREAMTQVLQAAHPGVRTVLDAPLQMQRETDRLRAAAGRAGDADLETLLSAAAAAWPDGAGPTQTLRFESGNLTLAAGGWGEPQVQQFRQRIRGAGYGAEFAEGRVVVSRLSPSTGARGAL